MNKVPFILDAFTYTSIYTSPDLITESTNSLILEGVSRFGIFKGHGGGGGGGVKSLISVGCTLN